MKPLKTEVDAFENGRLTRWLDAGVTQTRPDPPRHGLRVSGLPYCPLLALEAEAYNEWGEWDYSSDHYTSVGTALHNNLQRWLPRLEQTYEVWGNWRCTACRRKIADAPRPEPCACGRRGASWKYVEYTLLPYPGLDSAHCDLLLKNRRTGHWHLLDFKTTALKLWTQPGYDRYYPEKKHHIQMQTYAVLFWLLHRRRIAHYSIVYVSRERPFQDAGRGKKTKRVFYHRAYTYRFTPRLYEGTKAHLERATAGRQLIAQPGATAKQIYAVKPCTDRRVYLNYFSQKFFGSEECTHFLNGDCFKPAQMKANIKHWLALRERRLAREAQRLNRSRSKAVVKRPRGKKP